MHIRVSSSCWRSRWLRRPSPREAEEARGMTLSSTAFPDGGTIPLRFTQAGEGVTPGEGTSPALSWTYVPERTQSFVLHMHDMEHARSMTTEDKLHWLVWNIPGSATSLPRGSRAASACRTAPIRSARRARSIAARERRPRVRPITTCSSSWRWTRPSTSSPRTTPSRRAGWFWPPFRATSWPGPSTWGCSSGRSRCGGLVLRPTYFRPFPASPRLRTCQTAR